MYASFERRSRANRPSIVRENSVQTVDELAQSCLSFFFLFSRARSVRIQTRARRNARKEVLLDVSPRDSRRRCLDLSRFRAICDPVVLWYAPGGSLIASSSTFELFLSLFLRSSVTQCKNLTKQVETSFLS